MENQQALREALRVLRKQIKDDKVSQADVSRHHNALTKMAVKQGKPCERCGRVLPLTIDHIVPARIILELGFDVTRIFDEENIQLYCRACNHFKAGRLDITNPKTLPILKKYIALAEPHEQGAEGVQNLS